MSAPVAAPIPANKAPIWASNIFIALAAREQKPAGESDNQAPEYTVAHVVRRALHARHLIEGKRLRLSFLIDHDFRRRE